MGGSNQPQQQVFDPTPPNVRPLQQMLAQVFMGMAQRPQQNRNPMMGGGMPQFGNIFQQLFGMGTRANPLEMGGQGTMPPPMMVGGARPMGPPPMESMGSVPSGSRMIGSAPGGNMPTLSQMMMRRR